MGKVKRVHGCHRRALHSAARAAHRALPDSSDEVGTDMRLKRVRAPPLSSSHSITMAGISLLAGLSLSRAALIADWLLCPFRRREEARFLSAQAAQSAAGQSARL